MGCSAYYLIFADALRIGYSEIKMSSDKISYKHVCKYKRLNLSPIQPKFIICALFSL